MVELYQLVSRRANNVPFLPGLPYSLFPADFTDNVNTMLYLVLNKALKHISTNIHSLPIGLVTNDIRACDSFLVMARHQLYD